jgi:xanthine/uracil permease
MSCTEGDWMMLTFIFKYAWIMMLVLVYIILSVKSIKDIVNTKRVWKGEFEFSYLDKSTQGWIIMSFITILAASFVYWLVYAVEYEVS